MEMEQSEKWLLKHKIAVAGLLIIILAVALYMIALGMNKDETTVTTPTTVSNTPATTPTDNKTTPTTTTTKKTDSNDLVVTWQKPEQLSDLELISTKNGTKTTYYKVGTTSAGTIILAQAQVEGPSAAALYYYYQTNNLYKLLTKVSDPKTTIEDSDFTKSTDDTVTTISALSPDAHFTYGSTKFTKLKHLNLNSIFKDYGADTYKTTDQKVGTTKWGDLYQGTYQNTANPDDAYHANSIYYILLPDQTKYTFEPRPTFMKDDGTMDATWVDSAGKLVNFGKQRANGCGLGPISTPIGTAELSKVTQKQVATTADGKKLYIPTDANNAYVKWAYENYKSSHEGTTKTITDFINGYGLLLWTDDYGTVQIFANSDYQPAVECGKPVVYLYPEKEMRVSVKVGAQITKSDPTYGNGWLVTAKPDGTLTTGGKTYSSLFWEGLGYGIYPSLHEGTVVARDSVQKTITDQLTYIGLNQRETQDFLDFWMPKMPTTPYVRLTWFQNKAMDALAPMTITPRPQSIIRVFLDFAGQTEKTVIPAQTLQKMPRTGFTAVEWGGLLTGVNVQQTESQL